MRRGVVPGLVIPAGAGALIVALIAVHGYAQPATQRPGLRPAFEDPTEDEARRPATQRRGERKRDARPSSSSSSSSLPNLETPESARLPSFASPPASGAGLTGYNSVNTKRKGATKGATRTPAGSLVAPPLSITAPGTSPTAELLRNTAAGTSARTGSRTTGSSTTATGTVTAAAKAARVAAIPAPPRSPLVRIPDGTPTGGIAGTVNSTTLPAGAATLLRRRTALDEDPYAQLGLRTGAFIVLPAVDVTAGHDTNPARTQNGRASSFITTSPEVIARSDWTRHEVTATLRGSYTAYDKLPEFDRPSFDGKVTGRLDVLRDTALIGEGTLIVGTDNPGSPNVQAGLTRFPIYTTLGGTAGIQQRFNRVEVTAKGTVERTEYQDSQFTDGTTGSNADRDYNRYGATLRTSYDLMPGIKPFVEVSADTRRHDLKADRYGIDRDSDGWTLKGGSTFQISRKLTGEISAGWLERNYKDPSLQQLSGFLFDASLIYSMSALTNVKLTAATVAGETTVPGTAGTLTRNAGIEIEHSFRRWLIGAVKFNYGYDDYVGSARKDDRYSIAGSVTYKLNRMAQVKAEVRHDWLNSTIPGVDYEATVFMLGMRLQR